MNHRRCIKNYHCISLHSFAIARSKERNGNTVLICKIYKILGIPFLYRKNHPVLQISPPSLPVVLRQRANRCLCSPRNLLLYKQLLSYTFEHRSIQSQPFHFEEHFYHQEKRFLLCEKTCRGLHLQISLVLPKKPI